MAEREVRPLTCRDFDIWSSPAALHGTLLRSCRAADHNREALSRNPRSAPLSCIHTQFKTSLFSVELVGRVANLNLPQTEKKNIPVHTNTPAKPQCLKRQLSSRERAELKWFTQDAGTGAVLGAGRVLHMCTMAILI